MALLLVIKIMEMNRMAGRTPKDWFQAINFMQRESAVA
jgi:hypothetical protein